jgi:hypothetical protein
MLSVVLSLSKSDERMIIGGVPGAAAALGCQSRSSR